VNGIIKFVRTDDLATEKSPTLDEIYQHFAQNNNAYAKDLIDNIADYQSLYDKIEFVEVVKVGKNELGLAFLIENEPFGKNSDNRLASFSLSPHRRFPSPDEVKEDLINSVEGFADGCYEAALPSECLWAGKDGRVLGKFTFTNVMVRAPPWKEDEPIKLNPNSYSWVKKRDSIGKL
jgi:hypothetical protein